MLYIKLYETEKGSIVALCDEGLLGKKYTDKRTGAELDLNKYSDFYKGDLVNAEEAKRIVSQEYIYSANVVGNESVSLMVDVGLAASDEIKIIAKVPSLHIYRLL
ncbi:MAG: DUF424 family protein [Candidatus Marsarchaeota archaeon]|jgi:hypothetical protein|nr:DUF424 family protein [Candidatus Marsarchaeota archaeon]